MNNYGIVHFQSSKNESFSFTCQQLCASLMQPAISVYTSEIMLELLDEY